MLAIRMLATTTAVGVGAAIAMIGGAVPASAYEQSSITASTWAYTRSDNVHQSYVNGSADFPVGRQEKADGKYKSRFYFTVDLARLTGKKLYNAQFLVRQKAANDCSVTPPLQLWRTGTWAGNPTWANPPAELELLGAPALVGNVPCPGYIGLDLATAVAAALGRGEEKLNLELRVADSAEGDRDFGITLAYRPELEYDANQVPGIHGLYITQAFSSAKRCDPQDAPTLVWGNSGIYVGAVASGRETNETMTGEFALWPVNDPAQRKEFRATAFSQGDVRYELPQQVYPHGTVVALAARSYDGRDYSAWTEPCYLVIDSVAPANSPVISSTDYPEGTVGPGHGGTGVPGKFVVDAGGDPEVVRYQLRDRTGFPWIVDAPEPGASATFIYTPRYRFDNILWARSIDAAGNYSPERQYEFRVRETTPLVTVEMNGIGIPSRLLLKPAVEGITHYTYQVDDGATTTVSADAAGNAVAEVTFTEPGPRRVTVSGYTASGLSGAWTDNVWVHDRPRVTSAVMDGPTIHRGVNGVPMTWTFKPGKAGVVAYEYQFNWDQPIERVEANADGVAVFEWTPNGTMTEWWTGMVRSVYADGSVSDANAEISIQLTEKRPVLYGNIYNPYEAAGGVGVTDDITIVDEFAVPVEFVVKINDGEEFVVAAGGSNTAGFQVTPDRAGENVITAYARYADGTVSPTRVWKFLVA